MNENEDEMMEEAEEAEEVPGDAPKMAQPVLFDLVYAAPNTAPDKSGMIEIVARKDGKEASVYYDFGDDLDEMISFFGDDVVFSNARSKMKIGLQANLRAYLKANQNIEKLMANYKPGVALEKLPADMNKATEDYFAGLSGDEQDAMIAKLMSRKDA